MEATGTVITTTIADRTQETQARAMEATGTGSGGYRDYIWKSDESENTPEIQGYRNHKYSCNGRVRETSWTEDRTLGIQGWVLEATGTETI